MNNEDRFAFGSSVWPGVAKLIEETGELQQVLGKLIQTRGEPEHWDGTNLRVRLEEEVAAAMAALKFVMTYTELSEVNILCRAARKFTQFEEWHKDPTANRVKA